MQMPPLLFSHSRDRQIVQAYIVPTLFGMITGIALALSGALYFVFAVIIAVLGGFIAGLEHERIDDGALRGAIGGILFGTGLVLAHAISGKAKTSIPHPAIVLILFTAPIGSGLGSLGAWVRRGRDSS